MNIFERATRAKLRFPSEKGQLSVEELWDMPLKAKNGFDLDSVAKTVNALLKQESEESFVEVATNAKRTTLELQLEVVKHIIASKLLDKQVAETRAQSAARREQLEALLEKKQLAALEELTPEQILAQIEALKG